MQLHSLMIDGQQRGHRQSMGSGPARAAAALDFSSGLSYECQLDGEIGLRHRLVAVDLPGFGDSQPVVEPDTVLGIQGSARMVVKAVEALGLEDAVVVGWSLGGHVALEVLLQSCRTAKAC